MQPSVLLGFSDMFLMIIVKTIITLILDLFVAFVLLVVAPNTGLEFVEGLDYWNWFWIVLCVGTAIGPALTMNSLEVD